MISDSLIVDYINRFWIMDVDARIQLFDLKTKYQFQTTPGVDQYNMPLYDLQQSVGGNPQQPVSFYPVYQGFFDPVYVNGIQIRFYTQKNEFFNVFPPIVQNLTVVGTGNGSSGPYTLTIPIVNNIQPTPLNPPIQGILRGHIDILGVIAAAQLTGQNEDPPLVTSLDITNLVPFIESVPVTSVIPAIYFTAQAADGSNITICDSGQFLSGNQNYGLLMNPGKAPFGNLPLTGGPTPNYSTTQNTINYLTGIAQNVYFPQNIPSGANINAQCYYFNTGLPRALLYYNNIMTLRVPPAQQYLVELDAYLTPAAFLTTSQAIPFAYMSEYIARGAARKILSDTGDVEQFNFYEPFFKEQEMLVWKRSQRQFTSTRTETIYSHGMNQGNNWFYNNLGSFQ